MRTNRKHTGICKKVTVCIKDISLLERAQAKALRENTSLSAVIEEKLAEYVVDNDGK